MLLLLRALGVVGILMIYLALRWIVERTRPNPPTFKRYLVEMAVCALLAIVYLAIF